MDLELKKVFREETSLDVFAWDENNNVVFTEDYVKWLENRSRTYQLEVSSEINRRIDKIASSIQNSDDDARYLEGGLFELQDLREWMSNNS